ncbi:MAG: kanamycin nucleotidyltransferase C-terminal domain-containing protein [Caldilineaceae bacterium]
MCLEPKPIPYWKRVALAEQLVQRILAVHGEKVLAIGMYGSLARGTDQLYSDIEMMCAFNTTGEDYAHEWIEDSCKVEVNFASADEILHDAATVDAEWAITHGAYFDLKPLYGNPDFFSKVSDALHSPSQEMFAAALRELIIGSIYENMGKLRNSRLTGNTGYLSLLACTIAEQGALAIGLAHKKCYPTHALLLQESLAFANRPDGYDALCQLVTASNLSDGDAIAITIERFWVGLVVWAEENGFSLEKSYVAPL